MEHFHRIFAVGHMIISIAFVLCAVVLLVFASLEIWLGVNPFAEGELSVRVNNVLDGIALLTVAVAVLELGQTIMEEEVQREVPMSVPTRVRRFLSRFMIVLVVSLSIESLVAVFQFVHTDPSQLPNAAAIGLVAAVLLAAWGVFVKLNRSVEELEPEAIEWVQSEDEKIE